MRQDVLIVGIILIVVGLIMWFIGGNAYNNAYQNYQIASGLEMLGYNPNTYRTAMSFWSLFSGIGFVLLFMVGTPIAIIGAAVKDNKKTNFQKPYTAQNQIIQPQSPYREYSCKKCNQYIPSDANICPYCGYNLKEDKKTTFCPNCGTKLGGSPSFCFKCGYKLR